MTKEYIEKLLEKVAQDLNITEAQFDAAEAEYKKIATGYNVDIETVKSSISEENISEDIVLRKAVDFIKENAVIKTK